MKIIYKTKRLFGDMCVMLLTALVLSLTLTSCDEHEPIDLGIHPGHILLANGSVVSADSYFERGLDNAVGVVFTEQLEGEKYLAVQLEELPAKFFCDSTSMINGTSCDLTALDGRTNTIAMRNSYDAKNGHGSPLADAVFTSHRFGQSDFIPSVGEMKLLYAQRQLVNDVMSRLNDRKSGSAVLLALDDDGDCWYWTSTEVKEDQYKSAYLFSMNAGTWHDTPKYKQAYHARVVSAYYPYSSN